MNGQLDLKDGVLTVSPTQLAEIQTCARRWRHRYIDGRVRAGAAPARDGGKSFDAAMNVRYRQAGSQSPDTATQAAMEQTVQASMAGLELPLDEWRTPARYIEAVRLYNEHYQEEPFEVLGVQVAFDVALGEVPVKRSFWHTYYESLTPPGSAVVIPGFPDTIKVRLHGLLDLLIRHRQTGLVLVCDTKTASRWSSADQAAYDNNGQMKAYAWAVPEMRRQLGEQAGPPWATLPDQVHGCMVNAVVLRKPYVREGSASKATAKPRTEFHRFVINYSAERLEEWRQDALAHVQQALGWVASGHFPQSETACANHFGRPCEYLDVCTLPKSQRADALGSDWFKDYDRGPLAEAKSEEEEQL